MFLGIPFAEPPVGKNRFRPPKPKRPWRPAIYKAMEFSPECLQSTLFSSDTESIRDEDCLYLNVWSPLKTRPDQVFPVMLWIYGGAFMHGSASKLEYIGNKLAERGVVVVSCNYRLGALGFLVSLSDGLFGNYGLHDQKMAMQWVQDHIQNFGGDINRITLFGESAGAMSIGLHLLDQQLLRQLHQRKARFNSSRYNTMSSGGRKLFHSIILQSNPLGYKYRTVAVANFIGSAFKEQLDCEDLRCLQSESADELMHVQDTLMAVPRSMGDFFTWGPVLTDQSYQREIRLRPGPVANVSVRQPIDTMRELQQLDIPVIMGTTSHEGTVFVFTAFPTRMAKIIYQGLVTSFFRASAPQVLKLYSSLSKYISESPYPDYRLALSTIIGDYLFRCPNQLFAKQLTASKAKVYLYEFALPTRTPGYPCCDGLACHTAELPYVFNNMDVIESGYSWYEPGSISFETKLVKQTTSPISKPFPDIFGAASSWFGRQDNNNNDEDDGLLYRQAIDKKVSKLLADFWTNFAIYGDPNGDSTSTEGIDILRWPTFKVQYPNFDIDMKNNEKQNKRGKYKKSALSNEINIEGSISTNSNNDNNILHDDDDDYFESNNDNNNNNNNNNEMDYDYDPFQDARNILDIMGMKTLIPNNPNSNDVKSSRDSINDKANINDKLYDTSNSGGKSSSNIGMEFICFDEDPAVYLLENDCICNFWNRLEYQF